MDRHDMLEWAERELSRYATKVPVLKPLYKIPMKAGGFMMTTEQPKEEQASKRDNHFAGFAKLLEREINEAYVKRIESMESGVIYSGAEVAQEIQLLIARRAYDLAMHVLGNIWEVHNPEMLLYTTSDLTTWPESEQ